MSPVPDLMQENQTLRNLLRSLSSFIGDGAGGVLPKLGWDMADFNNFVNRSETDTAWESYQRRKKANATASGSQPSKRAAEDDATGNRAKRPRGPNEQDKDGDNGGPDYSLLVPLNASVPAVSNNLYSAGTGTPQDSGLFSELMRDSTGSPMFMQPPASASSSTGYRGPSGSSYPQSYMPPLSMNVETSLPSIPFHPVQNGNVQRRVSQSQPSPASPDVPDDDDDPARDETYKLIQLASQLRRETRR
jgi:hypothetical protein